jgi:hypothetical protein
MDIRSLLPDTARPDLFLQGVDLVLPAVKKKKSKTWVTVVGLQLLDTRSAPCTTRATTDTSCLHQRISAARDPGE